MGTIKGLIYAMSAAPSRWRNPLARRLAQWLRRRRVSIFCAVLLAAGGFVLLVPWGCTPKADSQSVTLSGRIIRVRLLGAVAQVSLMASQPPVYYSSSDSTERLLELPRNVPLTLMFASGGWRISGTTLGHGELVLRPSSVGSLAVNDVPYRGQFRLVPVSASQFDLINDVDIDDYLKGVLAKELFADWRPEAYRAQAVAARTYALYEKHVPRPEARSWDVLSDQRSQVYGGIRAETAKSRDAAVATRGIVLTYGPPGQERIFKTYFSSCCGGVTQSAADAFGDPLIEPLATHSSEPWCSISPRYNWGPIVITKQELARRIRLWAQSRSPALAAIPGLRSVEIASRNAMGRPTGYTITDTRGQRFALRGEDFRVAVNSGAAETTLYSSFIESVINEPDRIRFVGCHGHGHGVGMCQWCAEARARAGMRHEDILIASYPSARLVRAY